MSITQVFFALAGLFLTVTALVATLMKYYLDAKLEPIGQQVKMLVDYMVLHQGKIATLEERTKGLK